MIPKIIHYCWFGRGEKPKLIKKCIKSWKKYCPDYKIIEWNEDNVDINSCLYTKQAYECKKYAFVSDYVRLKVLYEYGGVYLDTDQKIIKSITPLLNLRGFIGFACKNAINTGMFGVEPKHEYISEWFKYYDGRKFIVGNEQDLLPNTEYSMELLKNSGLLYNDSRQEIYGMTVFPQTYFCPLYTDSFENCITKDTYSIHYFLATWRTAEARKSFKRAKWRKTKIYKFIDSVKIFPQRTVRFIIGDNMVEKIKKNIKK